MAEIRSPGRVEAAGWLSYVAVSWRKPWLVLAGWAVILAAAILGIFQIDIDTTTSSFLDRRSEAWMFYQQSVRDFAGDEFLTVAIEASEPYGASELALVVELSERLDALPGVRRVDSLSTVPLIGKKEDGSITMQAALEEGVPRNEAEAKD